MNQIILYRFFLFMMINDYIFLEIYIHTHTVFNFKNNEKKFNFFNILGKNLCNLIDMTSPEGRKLIRSLQKHWKVAIGTGSEIRSMVACKETKH